jgi:hypothetical protein
MSDQESAMNFPAPEFLEPSRQESTNFLHFLQLGRQLHQSLLQTVLYILFSPFHFV